MEGEDPLPQPLEATLLLNITHMEDKDPLPQPLETIAVTQNSTHRGEGEDPLSQPLVATTVIEYSTYGGRGPSVTASGGYNCYPIFHIGRERTLCHSLWRL